MRNYLFEVINTQLEIDNFKKAFVVNKKKFMTTPSNADKLQFQNSPLDQSYEIDAYDHVELITKVHIEKEIVSLLEQGMYKYSFPTDQLQMELISFITSYINRFLKESLESESKRTLNSLQESKEEYILSEKFQQKVQRASWMYFDKIVEMVIQRFEYLDLRLFSLI